MKRILVLIFVCAVFLSGCKALEVYTDASGQPHTQLTDTMQTASQVIGTAGKALPQPYGILAISISALIGSAASVILVFKAKDKNKSVW
jgi:uncharacterized protein YceK